MKPLRLPLAVLLLLCALSGCAKAPPSTSTLAGGVIVDSGGDLIRCGTSNDAVLTGDFTLDYVLTYDARVGTTRDPAEQSWPELEARIRRLVSDKLPEIAPSLDAYLDELESDDAAGVRIWHAEPR